MLTVEQILKPILQPSEQKSVRAEPQTRWLTFDGVPRSPAPGVPPIDATVQGMNPKLQNHLLEVCNKGPWPIFIYGNTGSGKTCAMACVYQFWRGVPVWVTAARAMRDVASGNRALMQAVSDPLQTFTADLICLDDVGVRAPTGPQALALWEILDRRGRMPLMATSNFSPEDLLAIYDDRIVSRLCCGTMIRLSDTDRRVEQARMIEV